ncbi:MAG: NAD(P)-dependent oxidoreductase [Fimbriimonadaceae bacterium]|nr:NAD(P)-dependent oxidoreductase [Fimbriimonadaceae bacterium]
MRILVTGAAGRIGGAIVERCAGRHETVAFDLLPPPLGDQRLTADVRDREAVFAAVAGCDAVIHPAGFHGGHLKDHSSAEFLEVNVIGLNHLYEAMLAHGVRRMVQSSTMEVVCGRDWLANGVAVLDEGTQPKPDAIYALSKYLGEHLAPFYLRQHGLTTAILRYMNVDTLTPQQAGYQMTARWVWRYDVAEANILAAECPQIGCEVFHIGPDTPLSNQDIQRSRRDPAAVLEQHWPGSVALLQRHGIPLADCLWPVAPIAKAQRLLGWQPQATFAQFLAELAAS